MTTTSTAIIRKLLILFLIFAGLYYAKGFLMPLAIGAVIVTLFLPLCKWLERMKIHRGIAVLACLLLLLIAIAAIAAIIGWQVSALVSDIALIKIKIIETFNKIQEYIFNHFGISAEEQSQLLKNEQSSITGFLQWLAGSTVDIFTNFIITLVYIFGLLYYRNHIKNFLLKLSQPGQREELEHVIIRATHVSQQYLIGLTKMIICLWIMYGIGFSLIGVKNPLLFAVICGLLEIVPFIGNLTGTSLTLMVTAVHGGDLSQLAGIVIIYGTVQLIQGWILEPLILGPQVRINPFATIVALLIGEFIWGIPGIVLAIPLTAIFKIVCDHIEPLKPYGFLIGEIESNKPENRFIKKIKVWFIKKKSVT